LHQRLKKTFDPRGILNPGRFYRGVLMDTRLADFVRHTRAGQQAEADPAQVRALRLLHRYLPDLPVAGR
jgi:hypothetical protein